MPVINARLVMGSIAAARWPWRVLKGCRNVPPGPVGYQRRNVERPLRNSVNSCQNPIDDIVRIRFAVAVQLAGHRAERSRPGRPAGGPGPETSRNLTLTPDDGLPRAAAILF